MIEKLKNFYSLLVLDKKLVLKHLVAGGAGFLGSHIVDKLMLDGEEVICLDNLISGNINNISRWLNNPKFSFVEHDIVNPINLEVDKIWHFSCVASPTLYQLDPIKTLNVCFNGTLNLLELARLNNAKLLLASSSEIYGVAEQYPQDEKYNGSVNPFSKRSCYSEGKRISESLCYSFIKKYKLDVSIARIFNAYGPKMQPNDGRVISNFVGNVLKKKPIIINGDGLQTRSFCYVDDIVDGLLKLMKSDYSIPINFGNPEEEYSIVEIAKLIIKILKFNVNIEFTSPIVDDPIRRRPNILLANKSLGWYPKYSIIKGLNKTIENFKTILNI